MTIISKVLLWGCISLFAFSISINGASVVLRKATLIWDESSDPTVVGTKIYMNTVPPTNSQTFNVAATNVYCVSNLLERTTYSFYVTAYTSNGMESLPSNTILIQDVSGYKNNTITIKLKSFSGTNNWSTYALNSVPTNGTVIGIPPSYLIYTPKSDFTGNDHFTYIINDGLSQMVTGWVGIAVSDQIVYLGTKLEWWTDMTSISNRYFNLTAFTNPSPFQFYRSSLIITNKPNVSNVVSLKTHLQWYTNMANINQQLFDIISFTNPPPSQFYRSYLIMTNKPF